MTQDGWRHLVVEAMTKYQAGHEDALELLVALLTEQDTAKQALRDKSYGWTGLGWMETVALIPPAETLEELGT